jgi:hypothetical protein
MSQDEARLQLWATGTFQASLNFFQLSHRASKTARGLEVFTKNAWFANLLRYQTFLLELEITLAFESNNLIVSREQAVNS